MASETAAIAELTHPSHSCLIYETPHEQLAVISEYLARGLVRGERCVFLESPERLDAIRKKMADDGVEVAEEERRGALMMVSDRDYLDQGHFNGQRIMGFLQKGLDEALTAGFTALRATGNLNWELGADQDFEKLITYESELDEFVGRHAIVGLCQYRRTAIPGHVIRNALETHKNVVVGSLLCTNNLYYEPPDIRFETEPTKKLNKQAERMCRRLAQTMQAERRREAAIQTLLDSNHPNGHTSTPPKS